MTKRSNAELKKMARTTLSGKWGTAIGITILYMLIVFGLSMLSTPFAMQVNNGYFIALGLVISFIISLIALIFAAGQILFFMNMCRGREYRIGDLVSAFKLHPDRFIVAGLLLMLLGIVLMLPVFALAFLNVLGIPSVAVLLIMIVWLVIGTILMVMISLRFALYTMLLLDNPDMGAIESLRVSSQYMRGNKGRYFYMELSFIGWILLGACSCYVGLLWVIPYMSATQVYFYLDVIGELDTQPTQESAPDAGIHMSSFE
ncbi:MAG: DUF975 family protein [Lachnospiraceae bacterium]|nr:DUF975 family protein [Lachnospiraceae bacterium]